MIKLNSVQLDQTRFLNMVHLLVIKFWKKVFLTIRFKVEIVLSNYLITVV